MNTGGHACPACSGFSETNYTVLHQQLCQAQQQVQRQQLAMSERAAEVDVLRSELAESRARASTVAAASSSAQSDFKVALARSNKLYSQELRHLQGLLQVGGMNGSSCCQVRNSSCWSFCGGHVRTKKHWFCVPGITVQLQLQRQLQSIVKCSLTGIGNL
jgi:hypothetical protein